MEGKASRTKTDLSRPRAILLLSLIVLLYNLAAFGRQDFFWPPVAPEGPDTARSAVAHTQRSFPIVRGAGAGPLTIRQKFLVGMRVDINRATMGEISELPGISDRVAGSVVAERNRIGRFQRPEELLDVAGIKKKRLQKILPFLSGFDNN